MATLSFKVSHRFSQPVVFFTTGTMALTEEFSGGAGVTAASGLGFLRGEVWLISSFRNAYPVLTESTSFTSRTLCKALPAVDAAFRNVSVTFLYTTCCGEGIDDDEDDDGVARLENWKDDDDEGEEDDGRNSRNWGNTRIR
jgi:hypothetical protein